MRVIIYLSLFIILNIATFCSSSGIDRSKRFSDPNENLLPCQNIVSAAKPWMGTPYVYGGNSKNGIDCSGFVQQMYIQVFNINLPRTTEKLYNRGTFVRSSWLNCGDLVFFKNIRGRGVDHVGIYVGENRFIHASSSRGVIISELTSDYYVEHFVSARRYIDQ